MGGGERQERLTLRDEVVAGFMSTDQGWETDLLPAGHRKLDPAGHDSLTSPPSLGDFT